MRTVYAKCGSVIPLGRLGENEATVVLFNVSNWLELFGDGTFHLVAQRNKDTEPYPCVISYADGVVTWQIREPDVSAAGYGKCELIYYVGETKVKSAIYTTVTGASLVGSREVPEPYEEWVQKVLEAADSINADLSGILNTDGAATPSYVWTATDEGAEWRKPTGGTGGGASSWSELYDKPFERIGQTLIAENGTLDINLHETTNAAGGITFIIG